MEHEPLKYSVQSIVSPSLSFLGPSSCPDSHQRAIYSASSDKPLQSISANSFPSMRNSTRSGESQKEQSRRLTGMGIRAGGGGVTRGGASGRVTGSLLLVKGEERLSDNVVVEDLGALE